MTSKENELINQIKRLPDWNNFGYKSTLDLSYTIAKVMGYKLYTFRDRTWGFANTEDTDKMVKIRRGMEKNGIIKFSKSGTTFKVLI